MTLQQDASAAAQALTEAQQRYAQIVGQMSGSGYVGGHIGFGGAGITGVPVTTGFGGIGGVPALTPTRF